MKKNRDKLKGQCYETATGTIKSYNRLYLDEVVITGKTYPFTEPTDD